MCGRGNPEKRQVTVALNPEKKSHRPAQAASGAASQSRALALRRLMSVGTHRPGAAAEPEEEAAPRRDRAQANRLVQGVLRNLTLIDALLLRPKLFDPAKTPKPVLWALRMAVYEKIFQANTPDYAIGEQTVELARQAGGAPAGRFANAIMRRLLPKLPETPEALREAAIWSELTPGQRWSIPPAIMKALESGYGAGAVELIAEAFSEREAPVWLRVNTLKTRPEAVLAECEAEAVEVIADASAPGEALRWTGNGGLPWSSAPWGRGEMTVQDVGAMLAARLLAPAPGERVVDYCAAPGGKTGHLWELMQGRGELRALEVNPARRKELRETLDRLYGANHGIQVAEEDRAAEGLEGGAYDRVLVDAPCQALGLIRRHPEIRWDDRLRHLAEMQATQGQILRGAARLVRPGGRLLWVTCSPTAAENEGIVEPFLKESREWWILDPEPLLPEAWRAWTQTAMGVLRTRPDRMDCDGFAMILLERLPR